MSAPAAPLSSGEVAWGILGTGGIARLFTRDLLAHGHRIAAVGSRSMRQARAFADEHGIGGAHGSYEELVSDPAVDIVYVATPHVLHAANGLLAIEAGKHVLIEKPYTLNAAEAAGVVQAASHAGVVVMEAMWTRFLPHMAYVRDAVRSGRLGTIRSVHADHTQSLPTDAAHRLNDRALGGGALLDLGVYPISFAHDLLGPATAVHALATMSPTGVDESVATMMRHPGDVLSTSYSSMRTRGPNQATVLGTAARLDVAATWYAPTSVRLTSPDGTVLDEFTSSVPGRGMQFQAAEMEGLVLAGRTASDLMSPAASVEVMHMLDTVRRTIGLSYPGEDRHPETT